MEIVLKTFNIIHGNTLNLYIYLYTNTATRDNKLILKLLRKLNKTE